MEKHFTQWLEENRRDGGTDCCPANAKRMLLADGVSLSVQASGFHYCSPRTDLSSYAEYDSFEVGFPSTKIPELMPFAEDESSPTETVYGWVPKSVLEYIIKEHGGIVGTCE